MTAPEQQERHIKADNSRFVNFRAHYYRWFCR